MSEPRRLLVAKIEHTGTHPRLGQSQTIPQYLIISCGRCDYENDGSYNATNHEVYTTTKNPDIQDDDWYRNPSTGEIQDTQPT